MDLLSQHGDRVAEIGGDVDASERPSDSPQSETSSAQKAVEMPHSRRSGQVPGNSARPFPRPDKAHETTPEGVGDQVIALFTSSG